MSIRGHEVASRWFQGVIQAIFCGEWRTVANAVVQPAPLGLSSLHYQATARDAALCAAGLAHSAVHAKLHGDVAPLGTSQEEFPLGTSQEEFLRIEKAFRVTESYFVRYGPMWRDIEPNVVAESRGDVELTKQIVTGAKESLETPSPVREGDTVLHVVTRLLVRHSLGPQESLVASCSMAGLSRWLLQRGAPVLLCNVHGDSPLDIGGLGWQRLINNEIAAPFFSGTQLGDHIGEARKIAPKLTVATHKGEAGRVGVLGGAVEYTGAPFYAAISALKAGADLSFIFCHEGAAGPIKSYSPELIVYPVLSHDADTVRNTGGTESGATATHQDRSAEDAMVNAVCNVLPRLHVLVAGPGLGRADIMLSATTRVLAAAREEGLPVVLDADALFLVSRNIDIVRGWKDVILTPNRVEFNRLKDAVGLEDTVLDDTDGRLDVKWGPLADIVVETERLAMALGGPTIVRKGVIDVITNGVETMVCGIQGSPRRCGGQGDVLAGVTACWMVWSRLHHAALRTEDPISYVLGCYASCCVTRMCANTAFQSAGRSMTAPDVYGRVCETMERFVPKRDNGLVETHRQVDGQNIVSIMGGWEPSVDISEFLDIGDDCDDWVGCGWSQASMSQSRQASQ